MIVSSRLLSEHEALRHGFFTRRGGVSEGPYASLNCGGASGDSEEHVKANRARVAARLHVAPQALLTVHQEHGTNVLIVQKSSAKHAQKKADGLVTNEAGLALGILTADCAPVLLADRKKRVVGAVHAGWRGAKDGVLEEVLLKMEGLGARRETIEAVIGPSISKEAYEVGADFRADFLRQDAWSVEFFSAPEGGHAFFDLGGYISKRMERAGILSCERIAQCSFGDSEMFFSHRRGQQSGSAAMGRQISAIVLSPPAC